jgi:hypothetical protein
MSRQRKQTPIPLQILQMGILVLGISGVGYLFTIDIFIAFVAVIAGSLLLGSF